MDNRQIISVSSENMLSIFSGTDLCHPYRFQPYFQFDVSFVEYKRFVNSMALKGLRVLHQMPARYKSALDFEDEGLFTRLFYWDMSVAVIAEVSLAECLGSNASIISHSFDTGEAVFNFNDAIAYVTATFSNDVIVKAVQMLGRATKYSISLNIKQMSKHNQLLYSYALILRCMSLDKKLLRVCVKFE